MEVKVAKGETMNEHAEPREVDIDKLVAEKIAKIDLPSKIQRELEDLKPHDPRELKPNIEKIISDRINLINFPLLIQRELAKNVPVLQSDGTDELDSKFRSMETDISSLKMKSTSNETKLEGVASQLRGFALQLQTVKPNQIPQIPPIPLMSQTLQKPLPVYEQPLSALQHHLAHETPPVNQSQNNIHSDTGRSAWEHKESLELLLCFDSNGKHIDRRRLWKKNGSDFKTCGTLHNLSELLKKLTYKQLKHIFISVGTNDLDLKDHEQVFGELRMVVDDIRGRFPGIKIIINELLPRKDARNAEVSRFNGLLGDFASSQADITVATQRTFTDMSMFFDDKHLHSSKVPVYAKNIINALLKAYGIQSKSELFLSPNGNQRVRTDASPTYGNNIQNRMKRIADYGSFDERSTQPPSLPPQQSSMNFRGGTTNQSQRNNEIIREALVNFSNVIMKCIQR